MRKIYYLLVLMMGMLSSNLGLAQQAELRHYDIDVRDFTQLIVVDGVNVEYTTGTDSVGTVSFECEPTVSSCLLFSNKNNCLKIQVDANALPVGAKLPTVKAVSSNLTKAENSGDSTVNVSGLRNVSTFSARLIGNGTLIVRDLNADNVNGAITTGSGHLVLAGKAIKAKLSNIGTGPLEANSLDCVSVKCVSFGTGDIDCHVTEQLTIIGAGSGTVYYSGNPKKVVNRTIGVKGKPIN